MKPELLGPITPERLLAWYPCSVENPKDFKIRAVIDFANRLIDSCHSTDRELQDFIQKSRELRAYQRSFLKFRNTDNGEEE